MASSFTLTPGSNCSLQPGRKVRGEGRRCESERSGREASTLALPDPVTSWRAIGLPVGVCTLVQQTGAWEREQS